MIEEIKRLAKQVWPQATAIDISPSDGSVRDPKGFRLVARNDAGITIWQFEAENLADMRDEVRRRRDVIRAETVSEQREEWTLETFVKILQRQVRELEAERRKIFALDKTADDAEMRHAILGLRSFRQLLADMESELKGDSTNTG